MAEEKKNGGHGEGCVCPACYGKTGMGMMGGRWSCGCGYGRHWTFFLLRTLLTILILIVVFWFGIMVGRLSASGYARTTRMMAAGGYGGNYPIGAYNPGGPMMRAGATSTPAAEY
ncbi:MAG TPA: hypothetical protein VMT81_01140 [Candidatus Paceibacterota bacterium]|nr:hypothetical protein [Candidatus Paceibacterota bacterium]